MGYNDNLVKKRNGSYVLKHKTKKHKEGECEDCGFNPTDSVFGGVFRYKKDDMLLVRNHMEEHLTFYSHTKTITPIWCDTCQTLKQYRCTLDTTRKDLKS
tara:strand:- start:1258 stop:1557 length:300 start_codon:yes stop_codon:yes gene_type:complete